MTLIDNSVSPYEPQKPSREGGTVPGSLLELAVWNVTCSDWGICHGTRKVRILCPVEKTVSRSE